MQRQGVVPGTSFSTSLMSLGGPPCSAVICCRREAPLFAARRSLLSLALAWAGDSPGTAPGAGAAVSAMSAAVVVWRVGSRWNQNSSVVVVVVVVEGPHVMSPTTDLARQTSTRKNSKWAVEPLARGSLPVASVGGCIAAHTRSGELAAPYVRRFAQHSLE